jgi:MoaA/NifB/PqqE/SkfB family radical SAM enzyme
MMINFPQIEDWHWEITRSCNQCCIHCIIGDLEINEMDTDMALNVISKMALFGGKRLHITGGEPFIRKDLRLIVSKARAMGLSVNVITNGILHDVIMLFMKDGLVDQVGVSIDGNEAIHDLIRGYGSYRKTVSTLKTIIALESIVSVYMTINSLSINCLREVISELIELGVSSFHLNEINYAGRVKVNQHLKISGLHEKQKIEIISLQLDPLIEISSFSNDHSSAISPRIAYVDCNGKIYPCAEFAIVDPETSIAALLDNDFSDKFQAYYSNVKISGKCMYSSYSAPGINICLNSSELCPAMKGE